MSAESPNSKGEAGSLSLISNSNDFEFLHISMGGSTPTKYLEDKSPLKMLEYKVLFPDIKEMPMEGCCGIRNPIISNSNLKARFSFGHGKESRANFALDHVPKLSGKPQPNSNQAIAMEPIFTGYQTLNCRSNKN